MRTPTHHFAISPFRHFAIAGIGLGAWALAYLLHDALHAELVPTLGIAQNTGDALVTAVIAMLAFALLPLASRTTSREARAAEEERRSRAEKCQAQEEAIRRVTEEMAMFAKFNDVVRGHLASVTRETIPLKNIPGVIAALGRGMGWKNAM